MAEEEELKNKVSNILDKLSLHDQIPLNVIMEQIEQLKIDLPALTLLVQQIRGLPSNGLNDLDFYFDMLNGLSKSRHDARSQILALINLRCSGWKERLKPNDETADITVLCGETTFKLHSELMSTKSNFFKAALDMPMKEKKEKRVEIKHVEIEIFQKVIEFIYEDNLEFEIESELAGLLDAADRFDIEEFKDKICENVSQIIEENEIEDKKVKFLANQLMKIVSSNKEEEGGQKSKDTTKDASQLYILEVAHLAKIFNAVKLLSVCAEFVVRMEIQIKLEDINENPKLVVKILEQHMKENDCLK